VEPNESNGTGGITQEEFDALRAELEAERARAQEAAVTATRELQARLGTLEATLAEKEEASARAAESYRALEQLHSGAVAAYRELVLASDPLLPADIVQGATVDEVRAAADRASGLVTSIREGLEARARAGHQAAVIPAGAPGRTPPDISALSPRDKIALGLKQARKED